MPLATLAGMLFLGFVVIAIVFVLGMRAKSPLLLKPFIRFQRAIINPRQMRSAGTPGAYAAVIRHRGRVSGRSYETPVGAEPVDDGFVIALVYGSRTSWLRNVLAAGSATIVHDGQAYAVDQPEIVPMQRRPGPLQRRRPPRLPLAGHRPGPPGPPGGPSRSPGADAGHVVDDQRDDHQRALTACDLDLPLGGWLHQARPAATPCG